MEIFRLVGSIFLEGSKAAEEQITNIDKKAEGLSSRLGAGIKTAAKWGAGIAVGASAAAGALYGMATKAAGVTDRIDKLSQKIGISRQGFQEWEFVLSQSGTDIEKLQVGLKTMVQRMDETIAGTGQGAEMFAKLGISVTDTTGAVRSQEAVFEDAVRALQRMPEGAEKARLAFELFGKAGMELMPLLNDTNASLDDMQQMAKDLGLVLSDEAVDAGVQFTDTIDQLKRSFGAVVANVGASVIPMIQTLADKIIEYMPQIQAVIKFVFDTISLLVQGFVDGIQLIISWVTTWASENEGTVAGIKDVFMDLFDAIKDFIVSFVEFAVAFWGKYGDSILAITKTAFTAISETIKFILAVITDLLTIFSALFTGDWEALWNGVKDLAVTVWNFISDFLRALWWQIYKQAVDTWNNIKSFFSSITDYIENLFTGLVKSAWNWGKNLIGNFIDGIKDMWDGLKDTLSNVGSTIAGFLGFHSPTELGPGKDADKWAPNFMKMFADGLRDNMHLVRDAMEDITVGLNPAAAGVSNNYGGNVININVTGGDSREQAEDIMRELHRLGVRF